MGMMIIRHGVSDYGKWRPQFDSTLQCSKGRVSATRRCFVPLTTKNEIVIIFDATDTKNKEFATSSNHEDVMTKAGVIDVPTMYCLELI